MEKTMEEKRMKSRAVPAPNDLLIAIRKKCLDCMGNHAKLVSECNSKECPLHPYRCVGVLPENAMISKDQLPGQLSMLQ